MANVPTGMPAGIWTMERSESTPRNTRDSTGTPSTGSTVFAAAIPGRCAAPPAPAIITFSPRDSADSQYSNNKSGVRCAETTRFSYATFSSSSFSAAWRIVSQSDLLPMMMPTSDGRRWVLLAIGRIIQTCSDAV